MYFLYTGLSCICTANVALTNSKVLFHLEPFGLLCFVLDQRCVVYLYLMKSLRPYCFFCTGLDVRLTTPRFTLGREYEVRIQTSLMS